MKIKYHTIATIGMDQNGNKVIRLAGLRKAIQTNGNLPFIHQNFEVGLNIHKLGNVAHKELKEWITAYGSPSAFRVISKLEA